MAKEVLAGLLAVQRDLKVPKNQYNAFAKYKYRSCEDILEAAKPLCNSEGIILTVGDTIEKLDSRYYVKATATVIDSATGDSFSVSACAREEEVKKGMDGAQVTGAASSYARKYALCGLFAIDDTKDADAMQTPTNNASIGAQALVNQVWNIAKQKNVSQAELQSIMMSKYKVQKSANLTLDQALDLKDNLLAYVQELRAAK